MAKMVNGESIKLSDISVKLKTVLQGVKEHEDTLKKANQALEYQVNNPKLGAMVSANTCDYDREGDHTSLDELRNLLALGSASKIIEKVRKLMEGEEKLKDLDSMFQSVESENKNLSTEIKDLQKRCEELTNSNIELKGRLETETTNRDRDMEQVKQEKEAVSQNVHVRDTQIQELEENIQSLKQKIKQLEAERETKSNEECSKCVAMEEEMENQKKSNEKIQRELEHAKKEITLLKSECETLQNTKNGPEDFALLDCAHCQRYRNDLRMEQKKNKTLSDELAELKTDLEEESEKRRELLPYKRKYENLKKRVDEQGNLEEQLTEANDQLTKEKRAVEKLQRELNERTQERDRLEVDRDSKEKTLKDKERIEGEMKTLTTCIQAKEEEISRLKLDLSAAKNEQSGVVKAKDEQLAGLRERINTSDAERKKLVKENQKLREDVDSAGITYKNHDKERAEMSTRVKELEKETDNLRGQLKKMEAKAKYGRGNVAGKQTDVKPPKRQRSPDTPEPPIRETQPARPLPVPRIISEGFREPDWWKQYQVDYVENMPQPNSNGPTNGGSSQSKGQGFTCPVCSHYFDDNNQLNVHLDTCAR